MKENVSGWHVLSKEELSMPSLFDDMSQKANEIALEADKKIRITKKQKEIGQIHKQI